MKKAILFATTLALALGARAATINSVGATFASDGGTVSPPIIVIGPNAPKPSPVARYSEIAASDSGKLPPVKGASPTAPKPVARYSEVAASDSGKLPPVKGASPTAPKPVARYSEIA